MQHLQLDFKAGSAQNSTLGSCGQLKHQLCARSFWNIEITAPCGTRTQPRPWEVPTYTEWGEPMHKGAGIPLHLLLGSSQETEPWEGPWSHTAAGCKQQEGQQDQGHPPAAQGHPEPPDLGWLSSTLAILLGRV